MQNQLAQLLLGNTAAAAAATADALTEVGSPLRKTFPTLPFPPSTPSANHQLTLGTINQQLNALSQQLSGLNQQTQNLQMHGAQAATSLLGGGAFNQQPTGNKMNNDLMSQQDLFQLNQDLLARLQQLNLGGGANAGNLSNANAMQSGSSSNSGPSSASPSSFIFTNPMNAGGRPNSFINTTNNLMLGASLAADTGGGNSLTPSPLSGTLNRNSFTPSPGLLDNYEHLLMNSNHNYEALQMQNDANNNAGNAMHDGGNLIRPISQGGSLKVTMAGKTPSSPGGSHPGNSSPSIMANEQAAATFQLTPVLKRPEKKVTLSSASPSCSSSQASSLRSDSNRSNPNMVTLKITDEEGHSHSPKRGSQPLSATPSFITRSTSEKVPNRSQMMQQVQRTTWARHTTK